MGPALLFVFPDLPPEPVVEMDPRLRGESRGSQDLERRPLIERSQLEPISKFWLNREVFKGI